MAKARKDNKGRALRKGESQRSQDNRYVYTYTNFAGKRVYVYALTLQELRQKENELLRDRLDGLDLYSASKLDLNTLVERYLNLKKDIRGNSAGCYIVNYNRYCKDTLGNRKVSSIKFSDILGFYQDMTAQGLKYSTINMVDKVLAPAFDMAVRDEIIRTNPCRGVMRQLRKKEETTKDKRAALTIEEQNEFISYVTNHPIFSEHKNLFIVMLGTGARIGEISGLRWDDIDFENRVIDINHAISYGYSGMKPPYSRDFHYGLPKTANSIRKIPMLDEVHDTLLEMYEEQKSTGFNKLVIDGVSGFVFSTKKGKPYQSFSVNSYINRIVETHNEEETSLAMAEKRNPVLLPHFSCHILRHTFCTRLCENGANIKAIQAVMGHTNIQTTLDIYADVTENTKKKAMDDLAKNFKIF